MQLSHIESDVLKQYVARVLSDHLDPHQYRAFFFGSRITGTNTDRSDIDLGVEGPKHLNAAVKLSIEEALENLPTLYKFDVVDFATVREEFRKKALESIEPIVWKKSIKISAGQ